MGEFRIEGSAERRVEYDLAVIQLEFVEKNMRYHIAAKKVMDDCENFLNEVASLGLKPEFFKLIADGVDECRYQDEGMTKSSRKLELRLPYNVGFINSIRELVNKAKYEVYFNIRYELSNGTEIDKELTKEAVLDSKNKAEEMAELLNMKVVGVAKFNIASDDRYYDEDDDCYEDDDCEDGKIINKICKLSSSYKASDRLGLKDSLLEKTVSIIWNIE